MKAITITDVARRAGVSPKTVSRVINGEAHVRPEVRDMVARVVADMNYRPNAFARGLSSSRSFLIGLFFDDPASGYAASIQRGALERARALGRHLVIEPISFDRSDWRRLLEDTLQGLRLDGAILTSPICDRADLIAVFEEHDVPVVRIAPGSDFDRTPQVRMDDRAAARTMTEHLLSLGHRDIAFVLGNPKHSASERRWLGFQDAMTAAGITPDPRRVFQGDFRFRSGLEAADALFGTSPHPTAVFASNDEMALGVLVAAMRNQIAVPRSVSIVGFDDVAIARMAWPQLTTIRQPNFEMGAAAIDLLIERRNAGADGKSETCRELPYELVIRSTCMPRSLA
ncbi:LacI family transcriptional regulator [Sphingomonas insulae]|uniref:LacI family DNA-binding transcriptional regulator n=1 Tax=Sphingomonas insulae TaxID=424800 RepID=A0ABP3T4I9_9SPHN|nr:LacI family DNA-binding transcriptional regulator [Sphingomonas insulae]NIJ29661.1 LacI family transcriptional regulator [Sphingomonas insulae]